MKIDFTKHMDSIREVIRSTLPPWQRMPQEYELIAEIEAKIETLEVIIGHADTVSVLEQTQGWKLFLMSMDARNVELMKSLLTCDKEKIDAIRAQVKENEFVRTFVSKVVADAEEAKQQRATLLERLTGGSDGSR